jgi:hypothetical protein
MARGTNSPFGVYIENNPLYLVRKDAQMGRYLLLWLLGVPIPILLLIWLFGGLH